MDYSSVGGILGIASIGIHVIEKFYMVVNHKRVRSNCCGIKTEVSLDVENTTPPAEKALVKSEGVSVNIPKNTL